jgi:hypothetical protein
MNWSGGFFDFRHNTLPFLRCDAILPVAREPNVFSKTFAALLALLAISTSPGCGTMANLEGRPHPWPGQAGQDPPTAFGGVRKEVGWIKTTGFPGSLMFVADLPASLVGDLVTLPKTVTSGRADPLLRNPTPGPSYPAVVLDTADNPNPTAY